jgi:hypothetical protein
MKYGAVTAVFVLAAGLSVGWCDEPKRTPVAFVAVGDVDDAVVKDAQAWAESNLALPVAVLEKQPAGKGLLDEQGREVARLLKPGDLGLVALVWPEQDIAEHGVILLEEHVVVVNMRAIRDGAADETRYMWRAERLALRGIATIMGLEPCPDPHCVFGFYNARDQLDSMGRNFCPPCLMKIQQAYKAQGIEADMDNPMNLLQGMPE